jgi:hypothetical protein
MVGDGSAVHPELFDTGDIVLYFVGAIQKAVFGVGVEVTKCHGVGFLPFISY